MLPDQVSNPGPLTYESGALPIALRSPALSICCLPVCYSVILLEIMVGKPIAVKYLTHSYLETRKRVICKQCRPRSDTT